MRVSGCVRVCIGERGGGEREGERERVCFDRLESHKFIGIFRCDFDLLSQNVCFLGNLRDEIWKSLYFRLHYTLQHGMDILSVCGHFWMEELMWMPMMWDEIDRWKIESVREWIRRREVETVRLTGECVLDEEWMTDICISFGMWNHWTFQFTFKQNEVCVRIIYLLFWMDLLSFSLKSLCAWVCMPVHWWRSLFFCETKSFRLVLNFSFLKIFISFSHLRARFWFLLWLCYLGQSLDEWKAFKMISFNFRFFFYPDACKPCTYKCYKESN